MENAKTQLADKIKSANNILVTVSRNPSVDQLAACIGLTLLLNKLDKHAAAVFSGQVPSTIEFLKPEDTLEKTTDSLRDFIIALDKSKADKLRYKVEDDVVRIFITPYRTSISQADLEFSQGDFNVDLVIALGVRQQEDLDQAITAHGRILHDATVASVTIATDSGLGSINWHDPQASSLSELVTDLAQTLGGNNLDNQIATALLTGIVAETDRFSNDKTSSQTMSASAALMSAGANQQLVATKLEESVAARPVAPTERPASVKNASNTEDGNGTLDIDHEQRDNPPPPPRPYNNPPTNIGVLPPVDETLPPQPPPPPPPAIRPDHPGSALSQGASLITEPPTLGGVLNASDTTDKLAAEAEGDLLSLPAEEAPYILGRGTPDPTPPPVPPVAAPVMPPQPPPPPPVTSPPPPLPPGMSHPTADIPHAVIDSEPTAPAAPASEQSGPASDDASVHGTLSDLEASIHSPHLSASGTLSDLEASVHSPHLGNLREEVDRALSSAPDTTTPPPIQALNAQPLGNDLHPPAATAPPLGNIPPPSIIAPSQSLLPSQPMATDSASDEQPSGAPTPRPHDDTQPAAGPQPADSNAPPPVPPPIPFQFGSGGPAM